MDESKNQIEGMDFEHSTVPYVPEERGSDSGVMRLFKKAVGFCICSVVILLPYRWRVSFSDWLGLAINGLYHRYISLLRWFFKELES